MTDPLFHLAEPAEWEAAVRAGRYERSTRGLSLAAVGFVHLATAEQWPGVRERYYADVVGMAVWFLSYSTWTGTNGVWLEDLYVDPAHRGSGLGQRLLQALARVCVDRGYRRLEWWVLDWNAPSIGFYESIGAVAQDEWTRFRLDGDALVTLAGPPD